MSKNRLSVVRRVLTTLVICARLRNGYTISQIQSEVQDVTGDIYSSRTVRRDLQTLVQLGLVEVIKKPGAHAKYRMTRSPRAQLPSPFGRLFLPESTASND